MPLKLVINVLHMIYQPIPVIALGNPVVKLQSNPVYPMSKSMFGTKVPRLVLYFCHVWFATPSFNHGMNANFALEKTSTFII